MKRLTLRRIVVSAVVTFCLTATVWAATPVVSNVTVSQRAGTKLVDIYYNLSDASGHANTVWINVSGNGGVSWTIPASSVSGAVGAGITPGTGKHIVWNAGQDWNGQLVPNCKVRVFANDGTTPIPPAGMVYIPGGSFQMGDNLDGDQSAQPLHNVQVNAFFMDATEVPGQLWQSVRTWAADNGYDISGGSYNAMDHPAQSMNWWDAVKWCNARSEKEGLTPVYYTDAAQTTVYRTGNLDITNACVKWTANGYRLPTEAEWEKAARGALQGKRFPWGDTITCANANYYAVPGSYSYDVNPTIGACAGNTTTPVGSYAANGYGLYDMAGNVWEWCWDWYDGQYYAKDEALNNPRGPAASTGIRLLRGGSWNVSACSARSAYRNYNYPNVAYSSIGFRCVRGL